MIEFQQWTTTDRANLINRQESIIDYIDLIVAQMEKLTTHSYVAKAQAKFLKDKKRKFRWKYCNTFRTSFGK